MRLFADINISTRIVTRLAALGHDVVRADAFLDPRAEDREIVELVRREGGGIRVHSLPAGAQSDE